MGKPAFDPNQPFETADESVDQATEQKPPFDPNAPFEAAPQKDTSVPSKDLNKPAFDPNKPFETPEEHYGSTGQHVLGDIEAIGRGVTGGLSDVLAKGMRSGASAIGVPEEYLHYIAPKTEDIAARQEARPMESAALELAGNAALMSKLPQIGSKAINSMLQMGLISGGDELSKSILGHGDPTDAVASHILGSSALGLLTGGLFGKAEKLGSKGLQALENSKMGTRIKSVIVGAGHSATFPGEEIVSLDKSPFTDFNLNEKSFKDGQRFYKSYMTQLPKWSARIGASTLGSIFGGVPGGTISLALEQALEHVAPGLSKKYIAPAILRAASSGTVEHLGDIIDHATKMQKGAAAASNAIESLFKAGGNKIIEKSTTDRDRQKLKDYVENGELNKEIQDQSQDQTQAPQEFAKGGAVEPEIKRQDSVAKVFPEQNVLLSAAKGRISGYLNSVRPTPNMKLPYDTEHKDQQKDKEYNKTLDLANNPLSILQHVKDGTLLPKHMASFTSMYPEVYSHLSKKMTERMNKAHVKKEKKPPYHVRQAMSLFLGSSLDSTLTPMGIQAAQNVFAQQRAQKSAQAPKMSESKIAEQTMTPDQSREKRLNKN